MSDEQPAASICPECGHGDGEHEFLCERGVEEIRERAYGSAARTLPLWLRRCRCRSYHRRTGLFWLPSEGRGLSAAWSQDQVENLLAESEGLRAENERLRAALEAIVSEYEGYMGTGQMLREFAQEALNG